MKIIVAVDGSKYSEAAVRKCCEIIGFDTETEIKIICVVDAAVPAGTAYFGVSGDFHLRIEKELNSMAETFVLDAQTVLREKLGDKIKIEVDVLKGLPKIEIVEEAEKWGADLIVVGSHGYGFFERMLIGSVSDAIIHHAHCSVLVVKTAEEDVKQ